MNKNELYQETYHNITALCKGEDDDIAKMATIVAELYQLPHYDWVGFYRVVAPFTMKIGPYQGRHGCLRIDYPPQKANAGVCAGAIRAQKTLIIDNVHEYPGHIACSEHTNSEIVVPIRGKNGEFIYVLDGDCNEYNGYDEIDLYWLEKICVENFGK